MNESSKNRKLLLVVMDGVGETDKKFGNAVKAAETPTMDSLKKSALYTTLRAHGTAVGMPSDSDIGNSEVGHNALGAGRIFDQGAKLVDNAIVTGSIYDGDSWKSLVSYVDQNKGTLHFIGLLSDGNVHSHERHLHSMLRRAKAEKVSRIRIHVLFDGRDVGEKSAEIYTKRLQEVIDELSDASFDVNVASGGGRMHITMDRYEADWEIVKRGWDAHVLGKAEGAVSLEEVIKKTRSDETITDQYIPAFVVKEGDKPIGEIFDGDGVVFFNFRGDRAIEISRAFAEEKFDKFDRERFPQVFYAGMMEYDGDLHIPENYLVSPPLIDNTLSEYLLNLKLKLFACSETQKFGHVTYFWNGNRSGYLDKTLEEYVEIRSDVGITFDKAPQMKAMEIADVAIDRMRKGAFDFGRINLANGDMVGHTGNFAATVKAVETVDQQLQRLIEVAGETNTQLLITADHGNADEMFDGKEENYPNWETNPSERPAPKTAHTRSPVPVYFHIPSSLQVTYSLENVEYRTLGNVANTVCEMLGIAQNPSYMPSLLKVNQG